MKISESVRIIIQEQNNFQVKDFIYLFIYLLLHNLTIKRIPRETVNKYKKLDGIKNKTKVEMK